MSRIAFLTIVLASAACGSRGGDTTEPTRTQAPQAAAPTTYHQPTAREETEPAPVPEREPAAKQAASDAEIAGIVVTGNRLEVEAAQLALNQTENADVMAFAQTLAADHTAANTQATALLERISIAPSYGDATEQMQQEAATRKAELEGQTGAAFDKAYVQAMLDGHQEKLDLLDAQLIPNADDPELAAFLRSMRTKIAAHLQHGKMLLSKLEGDAIEVPSQEQPPGEDDE